MVAVIHLFDDHADVFNRKKEKAIYFVATNPLKRYHSQQMQRLLKNQVPQRQYPA